MKLAVIPARGGSKRIPRKNIKEFCGKPMIVWSIEAAHKSGCFDQIIVSTDDNEIAEVAKRYGAEVPFMRPPSLSDDHTGTTAVIQHAIEFFLLSEISIDAVCCVYATAPFIMARDIRHGLRRLEEEKCDYVFPVTTYPSPIQRAIRVTKQGRIEMLNPEFFNTRSQDLEDTYHDAGQFYWGRTEAWLSNKIIFAADSIPLLLPRYQVQDIDTLEDWIYAEWMHKASHEK